jgi:hypothetical protein
MRYDDRQKWSVITITEMFNEMPDEYLANWEYQPNPHDFGDKIILSLRESSYFRLRE